MEMEHVCLNLIQFGVLLMPRYQTDKEVKDMISWISQRKSIYGIVIASNLDALLGELLQYRSKYGRF